MSIFDDMDMASAQFTKTDRVVYETIRKFPDLFVQGSLAAIAEETHLSAPSLTRFAKRVGYKGFSEFQYQFRSDLEERDENQTGSKSDAYAELLRKVERDVPDALLCDLVRRMRDASTVVATGASLSRIPAYHLFVMAGALLGKGLYLNADELTSHIGLRQQRIRVPQDAEQDSRAEVPAVRGARHYEPTPHTRKARGPGGGPPAAPLRRVTRRRDSRLHGLPHVPRTA